LCIQEVYTYLYYFLSSYALIPEGIAQNLKIKKLKNTKAKNNTENA